MSRGPWRRPLIKLVPTGVTRESKMAAARASTRRQSIGRAAVKVLVKREAFLDMTYLKLTWGLRSNSEVIELALQHLAQSVRDGTVTLVQDDEAAT